MALVGNFLPNTTTMLPIQISKLQKPRTMILCAKPERPKTSSGSGGKINSTLRVSTKNALGVKKVTPDTTIDANGEEDNNQKSKANAYDDDNAADAVKGEGLPTD